MKCPDGHTVADGSRPPPREYGSTPVTAVFVHGNPETAAVWGPLHRALGLDDILPLSPPGFGAPLPEGFGATSDDYVAWLAGELEAVGDPVDLVGHDWGSNHVMRLACQRPDLVRSWCADTAGAWAPDYVWHDMTRVWRTPGQGEQAIEGWLSMDLPARTALNEAMGMTPGAAGELAGAFDADMGRCILALYRSADEAAFARWREQLPNAAARPGLVIVATADDYTGSEAQHRWTAGRAGAQVAVLKGLGHWWMLQDPAAGADALRRFWAGL